MTASEREARIQELEGRIRRVDAEIRNLEEYLSDEYNSFVADNLMWTEKERSSYEGELRQLKEPDNLPAEQKA